MTTRTAKAGDHIELDMTFTAQTLSDKPDGYIAGIASTPSTDLYGHRVTKGAFDESIKRRGLTGPRGVKLLAYHDWHRPSGVMKRLETVGDNLEIEAQLNLNIGYVRDMYEAAKQNGGLSYSVGFMLEDFEFVDEKQEKEADYWLVVKQGDLMEVSVVLFPACVEAEMSFIKHMDTTSEFERALVAEKLCLSRNEAHRIALFAKRNLHLFQPKPPVPVEGESPAHPLLDQRQLQPMTALLAKAKAILSDRKGPST